MDTYSGEIMGDFMSNRNDQVLVTKDLQQALDHRECKGLIYHSGQGTTDTSNSNIKLLEENGIQISMQM